jgi:hypothetical protein
VGVTRNRTAAAEHVKTMVYNSVTTIERGFSVPSLTVGVSQIYLLRVL